MPRYNLDDYVDVNTRIDTFWERYPEGHIITELLSDPNQLDRVVVKAFVYRSSDALNPAATGLAFEEAGGPGANQTSHLENCETSAIGRALANLGLETSKHRASRQEMDKVNRFSSGVADPIPAKGLGKIFSDRAS